MRMAKRIVSGKAFLGQTWARTSILFPSLSRAMSTLGSSILKSPRLVSLDQHDEWSHGFSHPDTAPTQKCTDNKTVRIIDGKSIADEIRLGIAIEVSRMKESIGKVPSLAVILVGQRRDSLTYVRNKILACEEVGFRFSLDHLPENCTEEEICDKLSSFNDDPSIHGILVQLPLPQVIGTAFEQGKDTEYAKPRKRCGRLPSTQHGKFGCTGKRAFVHPMYP
nr:bifunctional protein FolD 1, mitochondrial-like isoform X1 [Ipomoea batatas]